MRFVTLVTLTHLVLLAALFAFHTPIKKSPPKKRLLTHTYTIHETQKVTAQVKTYPPKKAPPPQKKAIKSTPKKTSAPKKKPVKSAPKKTASKSKHTSKKALLNLMEESLSTLEKVPTTASKKISLPAKITLACEEGILSGYEEELALFIEHHLQLPEEGEIKIKLTLQRSGSYQSMRIVSTSKGTLKNYLEQNIASLSFPPFRVHYKGEARHTFTLTLTS